MAVVKNTNEISFGTPTAAWPAPTHVSIRTSGGTILWVVDLAVDSVSGMHTIPTTGREVIVEPETIVLTYPAGDSTAAGMAHIVNNIYTMGDDTIRLRLHSADPGDDGAGSEITGNGYSDVLLVVSGGHWTVTE